MPRRKNGELPLPSGWEEGRDIDGKVFYINHNTHQTTWIDPRDQYTKPQSFSDCVGDELPYGWEEVYDPQVGVYYVDHINQTNQLEDPRQQWHIEQEQMLKDYLITAQDDLEAKREIYTVKQQRLMLAQDEYQNLHDTLKGWKSSRTSLNSNSSVGSTKYDPDLIKADVILARKRVERLRHELEQIRAEMQYKQRGLETLAMVDQKLSGLETGYSVVEARKIMEEMQSIQKNLVSGQQEKQDLMQSLARLKEEFLKTKIGGSSPDVSTLSIPQEKLTTASQTDLRGEYGLSSSRYLAEITRLRLRYDDAKKKINLLKHQLADLEDEWDPGQNESDKDRLLLVQEKEQLLRELRSIDLRNRSEEEIENVNQRISKLGVDLNHAKEISNKQIADRLKQQERKTEILSDLAETTKQATLLEAQLKSMSMSTLSISSSSSLGSLGSLSASSRGSLNSLSMLDIYNQPRSTDMDLQDLHRRVEKLLQGHSISPIHENPVTVEPDVMAAATSGYLQSVMASSQDNLHLQPSATKTASPHSSLSSLSPPVSPYDMGPPPTYKQHMNVAKPPPPNSVPSIQRRPGLLPSSNTPLQNVNINIPIQIASSSQSKVVTENSPVVLQSKFESTVTETCSYSVQTSSSSMYQSETVQTSSSSMYQSETVESVYSQGNMSRRAQYPENLEVISNPPLSPISESSSGVGNGGNTRSVSAAVSDESVAGDSGVFEASVKRDMFDEVLEMGLECAQIQIKLKYDPFQNTLSVGIEQARNLTALQFPEGSKVCIKAALLPNPVVSWETSPSTDIRNPKFNEVFRIVILEKKLFTKTLQVNIWCLQDNRPDECAGCASVSLADFNAKEVSIRWYNVLSFKFMQSDTTVPSKKSSSSSDSSVREILGQNQRPASRSKGDKKDTVTKLLEASSAKLKKEGSDSQKHPAVSSLKEESSDESTVISSQTSTLTRNQGPDDMLGSQCNDTLKLEGSDGDLEEEDEMDYNELDMVEDVIRGFDNTLDGVCSSEGSTDQDDILAVETCDKETNTVQMKYPKVLAVSTKSQEDLIGSSRASAIRRSQTFSPACRQGVSYVCKLNRSDSDSSMPLYKKGPFQRNSLERRSLRLKKMPSSFGFRGGKVVTRTSFDVELDLQASQTKLSHLNEENSRLRELKQRLEEAKARGETELPPWLVDDEHFQKLLTEADKLRQKEELGQMTKQERRAEALMKRVTREVHRMKRSHPNALTTSFREKLAYITTANMQVPVLPSENNDDVTQVEDLLKDNRMGHQV